MKIITWNCNGAFRRKFHLIDNLVADILVIQECEDPSTIGGAYGDWAKNFCWIGQNKRRGLGVFAGPQVSLTKLEWNDNGLQSFLPCRVNDSFNLVAVWLKQANSPNFRYIGQLWKYLQLHDSKISIDPCLICGDFNSNVCWDEWDRWWNHSDVVRELSEINIVSIYHQALNEDQGKESLPTLYLHRNPKRPYHIDYAFASKVLLDTDGTVEVGGRDKWLEISDHMPMSFTIKA